MTLSEPICRKVILGCPFTITYLLLIGTEVIDLLYARVPKYHFDLPFLPCATYLLDPNYLNFSVPGCKTWPRLMSRAACAKILRDGSGVQLTSYSATPVQCRRAVLQSVETFG